MIDYDVKRVTDTTSYHRSGIYTVYDKKEVRTKTGEHVEEDLGQLDSIERNSVFALFEECVRYIAETGDESLAAIVELFVQRGYYWTKAAELAEGLKPILEKRREEQANNAVGMKSQDELDFQSFIKTGVLPKWFLLEDTIYPEQVTNSFKRLPGSLRETIVKNPSLLCSKDLNGSMSVLIRSIVFDAAPASKHWSATADPYLKIWGSNKDLHLEKPLKTSIINNTLAPAWKELNLTFPSRATLQYGSEAEHIIIEVWNDNRFKDSQMACAVIDCSHVAALALKRIRGLGNAETKQIDLTVRVDFSYGTSLKSIIPPDRYLALRSVHDAREPEKREAIMDIQLTFDKSLIDAVFQTLPE